MSPGDFNFGDFSNTYASQTVPAFPDPLGNLQPIQPNPQAAYPPPVAGHQPGYVPPAPRVGGEKRKAEAISPPNRVLSFEEAARLAAEEDKRRRNTAASARFRIKKKQREQALERLAKEMTEKVTVLEGRISALETENKWLKGLVTEKHGGREDILERLLKEFTSQVAKEKEKEEKEKEKEKEGGEVKDSINAAGATTSSSSSAAAESDKTSKKD